MKAEERKALETNDLKAGWEKMREGLGQGPPRIVVIGLVIAAVVVVLFLVWRWLANRAAEAGANALVVIQQMTDGTDIRALDKLVDSSSEKPVVFPNETTITARRDQLMVKQLQEFATSNPRSLEGRMARLRLARLSLYLGERDVTNPHPFFKQNAKDNLQRARDVYNKLAPDCADLPLLQQECILNQGRACESLGEFDEARKFYQQASKDANTPSGELAKQALARLDNKATEAQAQDLFKQTIGTEK
jgi:tetratricopeptide (TPR) repeat protein